MATGDKLVNLDVLKNTVQKEVVDLKSASDNTKNALINNDNVEMSLAWEYGNIDAQGEEQNDTATIFARTVGFYQPIRDMSVVVTRLTGTIIGICKYNLDGTFVERTYFSASQKTVDLLNGYKYRFFYNGDGAINPLDLGHMQTNVIFATPSCFATKQSVSDLAELTDTVIGNALFGTYEAQNLTIVSGKLFSITSMGEKTVSSGAYAVYTVTDELKGKISGFAWGDTQYPLYAILDSSDNILVRSNLTDGTVHSDISVEFPAGTAKIVINGTPTSVAIKTFEIINAESITDGMVKTIACTGDSVTEGMSTDGAHTADYGKDPYPAQLYTLLKDAGYTVNVLNQGHGGERIPDVCARIGAYACIFTENVTVPGDGSTVSLGVATFTNGRVSGTKLAIPYADGQGVDYNVFFTQSTTTNPVTIDGIDYTLSVVNNNENKIKKATADGASTLIKAGTMFFTNNDRSPDVNIVFAGINDLSSLTLERYITQMKACSVANKGKYLILGAHSPMWNSWSDLSGTASAKYATYKRACLEAFGVNWIDLYAEFTQYALDYALEGGYFTDLTEEQKAQIQSELNDKHIPGEFTYNGVDDNVHLNRIGYYVVAKIIYYRLLELNYV